ncbi:MAG: OmpA family protein [Candidatus Aminicenantes bacterium]|nr:OmpA family protein [Candidatus Aminicenantes bacterium]
MRAKTILCLLAVTLLLLWTGKASSSLALDEEEINIPPEAHQKAIQALKALGPERGALKLTYKALTIEGITRGLTARSEKIQAALKELGAEETETDYRIELPGDILFDFDKWTIRRDAEETLSKVGEVISAYEHPVSIIGHTDSKGSESYNLELSKKRAESVKQWLIDQAGIDSKRIETSGKGESEPVAPNTNPDGSDNPEGRQKNRRVEIRIQKN